jgi:hypothetical protein
MHQVAPSPETNAATTAAAPDAETLVVIQDPVSNAIPNRSASQTLALQNIQPPALRENAWTDVSGQANAPTGVVWPDPKPMPPLAMANTAPVNAPVYRVPDITENADPTSEFEIPIIIFPALAFALAVIGFGVRELIKHSEPQR